MIQLDLSSLYQPASGTSANGLLAIQLAERTKARGVADAAKRVDVSRDVTAFRKAVATAKTPDELLRNPSALKVILTANGLSDQAAYPALARKALLSDLSDPKSFANVSSDSRWKQVAQTLGFAAKGLDTLRQAKVQDMLADGYAEVDWRKSLDKTTPGLSAALAFRDSIGSVKTAYDVLGNSALRSVVLKALDIPPQIAFQTVEAQAKAVTAKLDFSRVGDKHYVDGLVQRYLAARSSEAQGSSGGGDLATLAVQARGLLV